MKLQTDLRQILCTGTGKQITMKLQTDLSIAWHLRQVKGDFSALMRAAEACGFLGMLQDILHLVVGKLV